MTPLTQAIGIGLLIFFAGFFASMIIVPIVEHKKAKGQDKK